MEKEVFKIPFIEHEAAMARFEDIIGRLTAALVLSNAINAAVICLILFFKKG